MTFRVQEPDGTETWFGRTTIPMVRASALVLRGFREEWKAARWQEELRKPEDGDRVARIRLSTHTGRPLATDRLLARLETRLGRRLRPFALWRPGKKKSAAEK